MRALLIDDERLARAEMRRLLQAHPEVEILGEAESVAEARALVEALQPQLLFLDVEMPGASGFDLLDLLTDGQERLPAVIFTTAFDQYALRAFEVGAIDYLLKPVTSERLSAALERISQVAAPERPSVPLSQFFVRSGERAWIVRAAEIRLIESEGNYARLFFANEHPLILRSLQVLQERLDDSFFRANRSQIVNLRWIAGMDVDVDGAVYATLKDGMRIVFSRRQAQLLKERMAL
ncbi:MAG TPA: response regulator [Acidobacteriaceae bacterium]